MLICPTYGIRKQIRDEYWQEIKETLKQNTEKQCIIWGTDNNGQIHMNQQNDQWGEIGPWTYANKTEKGNGEQLKKYCQKYQLSACNAKSIPKTMIKST